ncbi:hypothetical protein A2V68_02130 [candidate division Kazan bacterium RBG_13_50_9]|uniref:Uncharacterized protein n=1 Tax=candidate division Kazan bacterium RBG_13_50_9 TaxID=1798535 RepID=A0A1F4NRQ3_UNCK3|nr:MAG: hypothetical protein A2V68_02130 [candidate division Kazan bacterium RBG_13_50_9]
MFRRPRKSESGWKDLPTELIRAVGRKISFEPWEEAEAEALPNGGKLSSDALYGLLLRHLEFWRGRVKEMPLELSSATPRNLSVEMLANALVRITILVKDGNKPAKDRRGPEHFARCLRCQLRLLHSLEFFLESIEDYLSPSREPHTFYHLLALPLIALLSEISPPLPALVIRVISPDPALLGNFQVAFDQEMAEAIKAGGELSKEKLRQMVEKASALAGMITYFPKPEDPSNN